MSSVSYTNRQGHVYHLHRSTSKTGKPRFHFSMKRDGDLAETVPEGYEIYEHPNAQVYLRRIPPKVIADDETAAVEAGVRRFSKFQEFRVDVRKDTITIWVPDQDVDALSAFLDSALGVGRGIARDVLSRHISYSPMLRFILIDSEKREFIAQRYCYLGSIDDWIDIGYPDTLQNLVKTYVRHLGQDSYFELM
jgi:hypothetical protein